LGLDSRSSREAAGLSPALFLGFAAASIGGPLALTSLYVAGAAGPAIAAAGLTTLLALVAFLPPFAIWLSYSRRITSAGGLYAFVEAAVGPRVAGVQAAIWTVSYFLYLPYTVTYIVYDLLPVIFPGITPYRWELELLIPLAVVALALVPLAPVLIAIGVLAAGQLLLMSALGGLQLANLGTHSGSFTTQGVGATAMAKGVGNVSLLFVCASLPLFLGGETRGRNRTIRTGLTVAFVAVAAYFLFSAFPLGYAPQAIINAPIPGVAIAQAYAGRPFAITIGLATAISVGILILAEYIALSRLLHAWLKLNIRNALKLIAIPFLAANAISLTNPQGFYNQLLKPSLVAVYLSQLLVFAVYPLYNRRLTALLPATAASALMIYGLYTVATNELGLGS
jgi:amino acid transporter